MNFELFGLRRPASLGIRSRSSRIEGGEEKRPELGYRPLPSHFFFTVIHVNPNPKDILSIIEE